jgi:hypothetical protein
MSVTQSDFRSAILDPDVARPTGLVDGHGRAAGRRFDVYRNNVAVSLSEALEAAFPIIAKLVGANNFKTLAGAFLRAHPPKSPLMMFYGAEMPGFLNTFGPTSEIGYLPDIARLEIALRESYHAADITTLDPLELQELSTEELMASNITFAPAVRLVRSTWPIHAIWRFNAQDGAPKPSMAAEDILVLRPELDPNPHLLSTGGGAFVAALFSGESVGSAFETATAATDNFDLAETLALLLRGNAFKKLKD